MFNSQIKWDVLLDYLEDKARNYIERVKAEESMPGDPLISSVYRDIRTNIYVGINVPKSIEQRDY